MSATSTRSLATLLLGCTAMLAACERPPMEVTQRNYRGLGVEQVDNPRILAERAELHQAPAPLDPVDPTGQRASSIFRNLEALGHVDAGEFTRLMAAITQWVSPEQGCNYCHVAGNFADEGIYTKHVSRRMIQMTQHINSRWKEHVGETGVTCYTCHRGQVVPSAWWTMDPGQGDVFLGNTAAQNQPAMKVGLTSLPGDPFSRFLTGDEEIPVQAATALPTAGSDAGTIKDTEWTYALMVHFSQSLGINCTYCHNSRAFMPWDQSSPARVNAWHGIRMVREINDGFISPLADVLPDNRKGPAGDPYKVNCRTCHLGAAKPLMGVSMVKDYPNLAAPGGSGG